jgi:cell fate regulator YaaT (PSP1 superfamily)
MTHVVRVEFAGPARMQYCSAAGTTPALGDVVVVETDWGVGIGEVCGVLPSAVLDQLKVPIWTILRKATPTDLSRRATLIQREREARSFCRERILARGLPMKLTEVRIGLDSSKAMFYFTADGRVDFRELVKDLVQHLHTRVELRQIGVRDEAKVLGSAGACGRPVCCHAFLQGFAPVSIRMAKDQNLALNPGKLSGICGRLKCCLAYEHCLYADLKHGLPKVGGHVMTSRGPGVIRGQNILEQTVMVGLETGGQVTLTASEVTSRPRPDAGGRGQEPNRGATTRSAAEGQTGDRPAGGKDARDAGSGGRNRRPRQQEPSPARPPANGDELSPDLASLEEP